MRDDGQKRIRKDLKACFRAAINAADPAQALISHVASHGGAIEGLLPGIKAAGEGRIVLFGAGKAAETMGAAAEGILGGRLTDGILVVPEESGAGVAQRFTGTHPFVGPESVQGGQAMLSLAQGLGETDWALCVFSGGASSMVEVPAEGLSWEDLRDTGRVLLASGIDIRGVNIVRKHLSQLKGGGLARALAPARVICLVLSDVIDDDLSTIASGPCAPDGSTFQDAYAIIEEKGLVNELPSRVRAHLERGMQGIVPETPKASDACFLKVSHQVIASNATALEGAASEARRLGYEPWIDSTPVFGEAVALSTRYLQALQDLKNADRPVMLIRGGEPTVTLRGPSGKGGRSQELALAVSRGLGTEPGFAFLAGGTDGIDGNVDAAGAVVDGSTERIALGKGISVQSALDSHDAYPLLRETGDLLVTGKTGTNVLDVHLLAYRPTSGLQNIDHD